MILNSCTLVRESCCQVPDQMSIFEAWTFSGEGSRLKGRFEFYRRIYYSILDEAEEMKTLAEGMLKVVFPKRLMNCRVMAARILEYNIEEINDRLSLQINGFFEFLLNSYKGLYCSACDGRSHQFFDLEKQSFTLSQYFCQDLVAHSMHFLEYFHVRMVGLLNLLIKFSGSCKGDGSFDEYFIPEVDRFVETPEITEMLKLCKTSANETAWFGHCQPICEKFDFFDFDEFFAPNLGKIIHAINFLSENRIRILNSEAKLKIEVHDKLGEELLAAEKRKYLGLNETLKLSSTELLEANLADHSEYALNLQLVDFGEYTKLELKSWKLEFAEMGINPHSHGEQTYLDVIKYKVLLQKYPNRNGVCGLGSQVVVILLGLFLGVWG